MAEQRLDLNGATAEELSQLPGVGPVLAERIVAYRESFGPYEEASDVTAVRGIGDTSYLAFADRIAVDSPGEDSAEGSEMPPEQAPEVGREAEELSSGELLSEEGLPMAEEGSAGAGGAQLAPGEEWGEAAAVPEEPEEVVGPPDESLPEEGLPMAEEGSVGAGDAQLAPGEELGEAAAVPEEPEEVVGPLDESMPEVELSLEEEGAAESEQAQPAPSEEPGEAAEAPEPHDGVMPETELPVEAGPSGGLPDVAPPSMTGTDDVGGGEPQPAEETSEGPTRGATVDSAPSEVSAETTKPSSWWRKSAWLWIAFIGGLLGMIFALVVFAGINGSLDVGHSRAVLELESDVRSLTQDLSALQADADDLGSRLDALEGLTERMDEVESSVGDLTQRASDLTERTDVLEQDVAELSTEMDTMTQEVSELQDQAEQARSFFSGLQTLLQDIFGGAEGSSMRAPTPTPEGK